MNKFVVDSTCQEVVEMPQFMFIDVLTVLLKIVLTLFQTTNIRPFQTERVYRRQF